MNQKIVSCPVDSRTGASCVGADVEGVASVVAGDELCTISALARRYAEEGTPSSVWRRSAESRVLTW